MSDPRLERAGTDAVEPEGSEADIIEQSLDGASDGSDAPRLPDDPEVPPADAWEQAQPVTGDAGNDERR